MQRRDFFSTPFFDKGGKSVKMWRAAKKFDEKNYNASTLLSLFTLLWEEASGVPDLQYTWRFRGLSFGTSPLW